MNELLIKFAKAYNLALTFSVDPINENLQLSVLNWNTHQTKYFEFIRGINDDAEHIIIAVKKEFDFAF